MPSIRKTKKRIKGQIRMMERMFDNYAELGGMGGGIACSVLLNKIDKANEILEHLKLNNHALPQANT